MLVSAPALRLVALMSRVDLNAALDDARSESMVLRTRKQPVNNTYESNLEKKVSRRSRRRYSSSIHTERAFLRMRVSYRARETSTFCPKQREFSLLFENLREQATRSSQINAMHTNSADYKCLLFSRTSQQPRYDNRLFSSTVLRNDRISTIDRSKFISSLRLPLIER